MSDFPVIDVLIAMFFSLMAFRAFRSGSATDYLLGGAQCVGLLLLLSSYHLFACYLLLVTAMVYLLSQIRTGARIISRLLPVAGAATIVLSIFM